MISDLSPCNGFLRFTSGATPADLLVISMGLRVRHGALRANRPSHPRSAYITNTYTFRLLLHTLQSVKTDHLKLLCQYEGSGCRVMSYNNGQFYYNYLAIIKKYRICTTRKRHLFQMACQGIQCAIYTKWQQYSKEPYHFRVQNGPLRRLGLLDILKCTWWPKAR